MTEFCDSSKKNIQNSFVYKVISHYLCNPLLKKGTVLNKNNQIKSKLLRFKKINFKSLKNKFGQNKKGSYFCTPKSKMGGQKKAKRSLKVWK